jgi:L-lactate dehydrogenase complex protein LldG
MEIGGFVYLVNGIDGIREMLNMQSEKKGRMVTTILELQDIAELVSAEDDPHSYSDVELAIIKGHFGVAENGAVWITDELMVQRALPYICQHLAVVIEEETIQKTLHEAYEKIGEGNYGFGGFISGPSKTADIEQALVLGAHGPLSMTVFILQSNNG